MQGENRMTYCHIGDDPEITAMVNDSQGENPEYIDPLEEDPSSLDIAYGLSNLSDTVHVDSPGDIRGG